MIIKGQFTIAHFMKNIGTALNIHLHRLLRIKNILACFSLKTNVDIKK